MYLKRNLRHADLTFKGGDTLDASMMKQKTRGRGFCLKGGGEQQILGCIDRKTLHFEVSME